MVPGNPESPVCEAMLKGKNALVTGSTSGIGYAIARARPRAGANVALNGFGAAQITGANISMDGGWTAA